MSHLELKIPPPLIFLSLALGMWWQADFPAAADMLQTQRLWPAAPLLILAGICGLSALRIFLRNRTSIDPHRPAKASRLIVSGIYRLTRNPMYLALCGTLLAWSILLAMPLVLWGPILFAGYITRFQIIPEERFLRERFGEDYASYCKRVRRWL